MCYVTDVHSISCLLLAVVYNVECTLYSFILCLFFSFPRWPFICICCIVCLHGATRIVSYIMAKCSIVFVTIHYHIDLYLIIDTRFIFKHEFFDSIGWSLVKFEIFIWSLRRLFTHIFIFLLLFFLYFFFSFYCFEFLRYILFYLICFFIEYTFVHRHFINLKVILVCSLALVFMCELVKKEKH